jgi:hypothetical protein
MRDIQKIDQKPLLERTLIYFFDLASEFKIQEN